LSMFQSFFAVRMHAISNGSSLALDGWDRLILTMVFALLLLSLLFMARKLRWTYRTVQAG